MYGVRVLVVFSRIPYSGTKDMTKQKLIKELEDRLFEAEATLEFFEKKKQSEVLIEEQKRSIDGIKEFIEFLKQ